MTTILVYRTKKRFITELQSVFAPPTLKNNYLIELIYENIQLHLYIRRTDRSEPKSQDKLNETSGKIIKN